MKDLWILYFICGVAYFTREFAVSKGKDKYGYYSWFTHFIGSLFFATTWPFWTLIAVFRKLDA